MDKPEKDTKPESKTRLEDLPAPKVAPATAEQVKGGARRPLSPCI